MSSSAREHALLLCLARLELPDETRAQARALIEQGVDWDLLLSEAERQGLTLLLHRHLAGGGALPCPDASRQALASRARAIVGLGLALTGELVGLLPALEAAGGRPFVVKGPALAVAAYGDIASRPFGDVDVVVEPASARRCWDLLEARGYAPWPAIAPRWQERWIRSTHEQLFRRQGAPLQLDLHWELMPRAYGHALTREEVRPRLVRVALGPGEVWTLGPEDNLLFLLLHGLKHNWESLCWLVDVAELVRAAPRLDWDVVRRWSRGPGRCRPVQLGLHLAHRLLDAPVPAEVLAEGGRDPAVAGLVESVRAAFLDASLASSRRGVWARTVRSVWFRGMERPSDRLRHLHEWVLMPRPPDWEWLPLPAWAGPAYYVVRPLRLLLKHAGARLRPL